MRARPAQTDPWISLKKLIDLAADPRRDLDCMPGAAKSSQVEVKRLNPRERIPEKRLTFRYRANVMSPAEKSTLASTQRGDDIYEKVMS